MAPSRPKNTKNAGTQKPTILAPICKHTSLHKSPCPQRSSLRKAVRESLLDLSAVAIVTTPPPSPPPVTSPSPAQRLPIPVLRINATAQRSSLRQALRKSSQDVAAIGTAATSPPTPSSTSSLSPKFTPVKSCPPSSPRSPLSTTPPPVKRRSSISSYIATIERSLPNSTPISPSPPSPSSSRKSTTPQTKRVKKSGEKLGREDTKEIGNTTETKAKNSCRESEHLEVVGQADINGIPTSRKGWYRVRSIIAESYNRNGNLAYFVDWEGYDPRTGIGWPGSWVSSKNVSEAAIREWKEKQTR
ncbi:hypothetical protein F5Y11DRAFT_243968 [Daldinia sp. FL1419]|nr:hypothetical protein F5Y11DRAFT_243968 [Daldinia sp. FL1419]